MSRRREQERELTGTALPRDAVPFRLALDELELLRRQSHGLAAAPDEVDARKVAEVAEHLTVVMTQMAAAFERIARDASVTTTALRRLGALAPEEERIAQPPSQEWHNHPWGTVCRVGCPARQRLSVDVPPRFIGGTGPEGRL